WRRSGRMRSIRGCSDGRGWSGDLPNRRRHIRARETPRQQLLDLPLALAARLGEQRFVIDTREVRRKKPDGRQVDAGARQQTEDRGYRRATFAAFILSYASCSEWPRTTRQYVKSDAKPAR